MKQLSREQKKALISHHLKFPKDLESANLDNETGWVYHRDYGVFLAEMGDHVRLSMMLFAWELGISTIDEIPNETIQKISPRNSAGDWHACQDWMVENVPGFVLKSSASKNSIILNDVEFLTIREYVRFKRFGIMEI